MCVVLTLDNSTTVILLVSFEEYIGPNSIIIDLEVYVPSSEIRHTFRFLVIFQSAYENVWCWQALCRLAERAQEK